MIPRLSTPWRPLRAFPVLVFLALAALATACGKSQPYGQQSSVIVVMPDSVWAEVEDTTYAAIEREVDAARREKKYHVTQIDPTDPKLSQLRLWYQIVVVGPPSDELVRQVLDAAGARNVSPPAMVGTESIWSRGQVVRAVVTPPGDMAAAWTAHLDELYVDIEKSYRAFIRNRMWISGRDTLLADSLMDRYGFALDVPRVYQVIRYDSLVIFRNDNPSPADLIRSVTVAWRDPGPDSLTAGYALDWRARLDSTHYGTPQSATLDSGSARRFRHQGNGALSVRGRWADEGPYPAGGPMTLWLVRCGDRTYLLDSWLYAPNPERGKYQYLLQMEWIRESFRCTPDGPG